MPELPALPAAERRHLQAITGPLGILQHSIGARPDPIHGYCTDDVARALQVDLLHARALGWPAVAHDAKRDLAFVVEAYDRTTGRFRNFRDVDGTWLAGPGSEDCQGRALHALGDVIAQAPDVRMAAAAAAVFESALPAARKLRAIRARASVVLGGAAVARVAPTGAVVETARTMADRLLRTFRLARIPDWPWPEPALTYENALPARALIVAGQTFDSPQMVETGRRVLDWLIDLQTSADGHLSPIGNGWFPRSGERSRFDQQPIEAMSLLLAAEAAWRVTGETGFLATMERAYAWFLGANDIGHAVAEPERGACFDGLTPSGVNRNQGAESTLMWLTAVEHLRAVRLPAIGPTPRTPGSPRSSFAVASR